jgi:16S rRNA (guanine527-N7)-methyltransferase
MDAKLETYLALLLRWNARMNLTAVREPEQIVRRHFGESLFVARHVPSDVPRGTSTSPTLLDHGSGAGFPGLPIALARPEIAVTLSESQSKKAAFLREAVRELELPNATVHAGRTEELPASRQFHVVTMRAVDHAEQAYPAGFARVAPGGCLMAVEAGTSPQTLHPASEEFPLPQCASVLRIYRVP